MKTPLLTGTALLLATATLSAQWAQVTPLTPPSARAQGAMTTGPTGNLLMFGGALAFGGTNQTHSYNGTAWTLLSTTGTPSVRSRMQMVYDPNAGVFRMYGGINQGFIGSTIFDQTWEFNGSIWSQNVIVGATPGGLFDYGMSFDSVNNVTVVFGGLPDDFFPIDSNQTWEFDGTNWTQTAMSPATNPGPLENPSMCFHAGLGKTVLFGGIDVQTGGVDTTWTYDAATNVWAVVPIVGAKPSPRTAASMAYDSVRGVCVLSGGLAAGSPTVLNDTWEFDGTTWTQVPSTLPTGTFFSPMAFMPVRRQMVHFGGISNAIFGTLDGSTREYGAKTRTFGAGCAGSNGVPGLSSTDAPRLGENYTLNLTGLNTTVNIGVVVLSLTEIAATPLDGIGMIGCNAYISPDVLLTVSGAGGTASWTTSSPWPNTVSLMGTGIYSQALSLDPNFNPAWLTASNAHHGTLGR